VRRVYTALTGLLLLAVVVQFYFAAVGAFAKPQDDKSFALHSVTGMMVIPLLSILATIAAAVARAPGRLIGMTILPLGLVIVQVLIVVVGRAFNTDADTTTPVGLAILGLHALNGIAIGGVAGHTFTSARRFATATTAAADAAAVPVR
jgi:hypothetical protein